MKLILSFDNEELLILVHGLTDCVIVNELEQPAALVPLMV